MMSDKTKRYKDGVDDMVMVGDGEGDDDEDDDGDGWSLWGAGRSSRSAVDGWLWLACPVCWLRGQSSRRVQVRMLSLQ